jgi:hypothetical protein
MKLNFKYDLDKDIENFVKASKSKNNKKPSPMMAEYIEEYRGDYDEDSLKSFILSRTKDIDIEEKLNEIKDNWSQIEDDYISISEKLFNVLLPLQEITVYLTINQRCTYNLKDKYFFDSLSRSDVSNHILMHELFHFYTWDAFGREMIKNGYDPLKYNDIKESLTVLLNIEYKDLMKNMVDKGYSQHKAMREEILKLWSHRHTIKEVLERLA